jgi:hypothetical protein
LSKPSRVGGWVGEVKRKSWVSEANTMSSIGKGGRACAPPPGYYLPALAWLSSAMMACSSFSAALL